MRQTLQELSFIEKYIFIVVAWAIWAVKAKNANELADWGVANSYKQKTWINMENKWIKKMLEELSIENY